MSWVRLGLPLANPFRAWAAAGIVTAYYLWAMAADLTVYDSAELALVAHELGLGHPIGQPLHTLLGYVAAKLTASPLVGIAGLSAVAAGLSMLPLGAVLDHLEGVRSDRIGWWVGLAGLVLLALHGTPWDPATRIEVYSLANLAGLYAVAVVLGHTPTRRAAFVAGIALGLAGCANAVVAAAFGLAVLPLAVVRGSKAERPFLVVPAALAGLALGLLPYLYIPWVAGRTDAFVWGAPTTADALGAYLRGSDYAHNQTISAGGLVGHLGELGLHSLRRGLLPVLLVGLGAHASRGRHAGRAILPVALLVTATFVAFNVVFHPDVPDYQGYLAGPHLLAGAGVVGATVAGIERGGRHRAFAVIGPLVLLLPLLLPPWAWLTPRSTPSIARALVTRAAQDAPPNAVLVVEGDHWVAPLLYAQEVEGVRPDLVVLPYGLGSSGWYWDHVGRRHPDLAPFALRGEGGRDGRLRRFLAAQARPVLVENERLAIRLGRRLCGVGALLFTEAACEAGAPDADAVSEAFDRATPRYGDGLEAATRVGFARGLALWRLGRGAEAYRALTAGLGEAYELPVTREPPAAIGPLGGPQPGFERPAAIHDPARNLFLAGHLLRAAGDTDGAAEWIALAAADGLPEAKALVEAAGR